MQSVSWWQSLYEGVRAANMTTAYGQARQLDSQYYYDMAYYVDGATAMFRATQDTDYLDDALDLTNIVLDNAVESHSLEDDPWTDGYLGWRSERVDVAGTEVPLFESYCWRYVTSMLRVMKEHPAVYNRTHYRNQYKRILEFSETNIFEKWYTRNANSYVYRSNTHMASHWAFMAMNLMLLTEDTTKRCTYFTVMNNIHHHLPNHSSGNLREQFIAHPSSSSAYFWSDTWNSTATPGQDVAHGNAVMAYLVDAHEKGIEWSDADMVKFRITFNSYIWPAPTTYRAYVDGTGTGTGWFNDGFCKLGRYSQTLQERLEGHSVGNNIQLYGNCALNVYLLNNGSGL